MWNPHFEFVIHSLSNIREQCSVSFTCMSEGVVLMFLYELLLLLFFYKLVLENVVLNSDFTSCLLDGYCCCFVLSTA